MRVTKIKIKNLFGISEYEADGKSVELVGKNGAGKTSVLDAIRYALTNQSDREYIIKNGEKEGEIFIETDTGLTIDRKARTDRADYKSVKQGKDAVGSPEAFLRTIFTPLQLEPMEFIAMDKKQQNAIILNMIEFPWDMNTIKEWFGEIPQDVNYDQNILSVLNDIQAENGYYFQHRQDINREIKAKKAVIADIEESLPVGYDGTIWEDKNIGDLYTKIEKIRKENETIEKAKRLIDGHDQKVRGLQADKEIKLAALDREMTAEETMIEKELAKLKEQINSLQDKKKSIAGTKKDREKVIESEYTAAVAKYEAETAEYAEYAGMSIKPVDTLLTEAEEVEKMKSHIGEWKRMLSITEEVEELKEESGLLTAKIEKARTLPGEILETAKIPIDGLSVKDGIALINGLPISNLSEGEKINLALEVSIANPGGLSIVLLDGMESLAPNMRKEVYKKCKDKGIQFIATRTAENEDLTVIEL